MKTPLLTGQIALVTGSNRGIGKQISISLAAAGAVVILAARNTDSLADVEQCIQDAGGQCHKVQLDVTVASQVKEVIDNLVSVHGKIDLLVNNAGIANGGSLPWEQDVDDWWSVFEVNVRGAYLCSHACLQHMSKASCGRIIDICSLVGTYPQMMASAYSASKAALRVLSTCFAAAAKDYGVSIFAISPGLVATDMTDSPHFEEIPASEWVPIEKCGELAVALASGKADELSGSFIHAALDDLDELLAQESTSG